MSALRPRDAASLVLLREDKDGPRILMGRRPPKQAFMPDVYVFPGGAVDPRDGYVPVARDLRPEVQQALARGCTHHRARAIALAALRETQEETGLFVGRAAAQPKRGLHPAWKPFGDMGLLPDLGSLEFLAHAVTPPGPPRRFHARFFLADGNEATGTLKSNGELLDLDWYPMDMLKTLPMASITQLVLQEVDKSRPGNTPTERAVPFFSRRHGRRVVRYEKADGSVVHAGFDLTSPHDVKSPKEKV